MPQKDFFNKIGTNRTSSVVRSSVANRGKPDMARIARLVGNEPIQTPAARCSEQLRLSLKASGCRRSVLGFHQVIPYVHRLGVVMASYDSDRVAHIHEELHSHLPS